MADSNDAASLRRAAEGGDPLAQYDYAVALLKGEGVERDPAAGVAWLRRAMDQGDVPALRDLGVAYRKGVGVEQDEAKAMELFRRAAEQGDATAQWFLGLALQQGEGAAADPAGAVAWFHRAAEQDQPGACYSLGIALLRGEGVPADKAAATRWLARSSSLGFGPAQDFALVSKPAPVPGNPPSHPPLAYRERFTEEEWGTLKLLPLSLFNLIAMADGLTDDPEFEALSRQIRAPDHADPLARELFADLRRANATQLLMEASDPRQSAALHNACRSALERVLAPEEFRSFIALLLKNARAVAAASGGFFGFGNRISRREAEVLREIASHFAFELDDSLNPKI